jgi:RNA polymerase sigma-70 factor (ECF subfamily)
MKLGRTSGHEQESNDVTDQPRHTAAAALFREHAGFVAAFARRLGIPESDLDDVVQEVFIVAHRRGGYVEGAATPRTWLAHIATNVASVTRRSTRRRRTMADEEIVSRAIAEGASPARAAETAQSLARVQRALDTLDVDHSTVFVLFEIEGETCDSIAAAQGVPVGTVHSRLHSARAKFKKAWERHDG